MAHPPLGVRQGHPVVQVLRWPSVISPSPRERPYSPPLVSWRKPSSCKRAKSGRCEAAQQCRDAFPCPLPPPLTVLCGAVPNSKKRQMYSANTPAADGSFVCESPTCCLLGLLARSS